MMLCQLYPSKAGGKIHTKLAESLSRSLAGAAARAGCPEGSLCGCDGARTARLTHSCLSATVAINLIVQHIQDILNGDICKWQRGGANGRSYKRTFPEPGDHPGVLTAGKRSHLESSSRPH